MDIYGFVLAGCLITMGTLGDRFGRRRLLLIGAAGFGVASVLSAFSTSAEMLIAARALLGVAGATFRPVSVAGAICGVRAASLMRVERDEQTGRIVTEAGVGYAALWVIVFGGRLAFAWAATNLWPHQVMQFSVQHAITSSAAWTAAFVLMALAMVVARTVVVATRALLVDGPLPLRSALKV